ncbi:MAG: DUF58 domain-containing protein [Planctomycetaceae bacterium]|nr:DUF58 domain-containing protein [Planctomycetaceae bacterium]
MNSGREFATADYLHPETLAQVAGIDLRARLIVEGLMTGLHRSPYQGQAVEFAEHRQYTPGDDLRHLDWKVFGRTDKLYLKRYQQETNLDLILLVDGSGSMDYGSSTRSGHVWRKFDHATSIAAVLAYQALLQQDRVGLIVFADRVLDMIRPSGARDQWRSIITALGTQPVNAETQIERVADEALSLINRRALVVVLSDLFESIDALGAALARLRFQQHDVVLFQTLDAHELQFPFEAPTRFVGLESEGRLDLDPRALRTAYLEQVEQHVGSVSESARRFGFDHEVIDTSQPIGPVLSHYLARRNARLKML